MRLWDVQHGKLVGMESNLSHKQLMKAKDSRGLKIGISAASYCHKGDLIMAGCLDGSLQLWDLRENTLHRPSITVPRAHDTNQGEITCIKPLR